jgi:CBS domain-containing membrane protein
MTLLLEDVKTIKVRDVMTAEVFTLEREDSLGIVREFMNWQNIRHIPVTDVASTLVGLVTHRDFLGLAISKLAGLPEEEVTKLYNSIPISEIMRTDVMSVSPELPLTEAAKIMMAHKYGCLPVVEDGKLVGIVTEADFVKWFAKLTEALERFD